MGWEEYIKPFTTFSEMVCNVPCYSKTGEARMVIIVGCLLDVTYVGCPRLVEFVFASILKY